MFSICQVSRGFALPLVLSDLASLEFSNADTLVHVDLPSKSKKMFGMRHLHLAGSFKGLYHDDEKERRGLSHILLCPEERERLRSTRFFEKCFFRGLNSQRLFYFQDCLFPAEV